MKRTARVALAAILVLAAGMAGPAAAQSNNDDFTPLNSRIKRDRQFPTDLQPRFNRDQVSRATRERGTAMLNQLSGCIYRRSKTNALELLSKTDFGFASFQQIDLEGDRALRIYGFQDCLGRVATSNHSGVALRFNPGALRQWLLQEAYLDRYPEGAEWVTAGNVVSERQFPLSGDNAAVRVLMDFADCIVATSPYNADWFFRTVSGAPAEAEAINALMPALAPCLPAGQRIEVSPAALRVWIGEALWHASQNNQPQVASAE